MTGISVKEYKIHNLQKEYHKFSCFLFNFQEHIKFCYRENIIVINERISLLKTINDLLRKMNNIYNINMTIICEDNKSKNVSSLESQKLLSDIFSLTQKSLDSLNNSNTYDEIRNLVNMYKTLNIEYKNSESDNYLNIFDDPFLEISELMAEELGKKIGFRTIDDGMILLIGEQYEKFYDKDIMQDIELYNDIFIPLSFNITKKNENREILLEKKGININAILDNCAEIHIKKIDTNDLFITFKGFFRNDSLNIVTRTSQICNNKIFQQKREIENYISKKSQIDEKFMRSYIRNSPIADIIILSNIQFLKQLETDYNMYNKLSKSTFMNLMKEFIKDKKNERACIKHMYKIIKLLLLGSEEDINIAGLLYGVSKEKRPGLDCSISDIIYRNLNYVSQIKLRKTSVSIKNELEKIKSISIDDIDFRKQIAICKNMPNNVKKAALEKVDEMKSSGNEYFKQQLYVKTLLNYPWTSDDDSIFTSLNKNNKKSIDFLDNVDKELDNRVYGHKTCKESIKELIGKWISNPKSAGSALGFSGPPGVGKTLIAKAIGEALDIPFVQITLGGQNDGDILHGHGYTYAGAQPGIIIKKMCEAGNARCIIYFDELDKACKKNDSNEIHNILIHLIDPNVNSEFQDRFFQEITFPLNKALFIFSYNDSQLIDKILLDRITEIKVKPYKLYEKINIANKFIIKEMSDMIGFENKSITFKNEDLEFIINKYTNEPGVRDFKRKIEKIFLKINIQKIYRTNIFKNINEISKENPILINRDTIIDFLGKNYADVEKIHEHNLVGVLNGLYATDSGKGGILPIQVYNNFTGDDEKFTLKLTGNQRKIMKESVISAFTASLHIVNEKIRKKYVLDNPHGFHVHLPGCAIPKDGPSAGIAFSTAFVSRILNKKIRHNIAMTGEIELTGKITKIGGLQYKLTGAKRAGVELVLIPKENEDDLNLIKKEYKDIFESNFKVITVDNIKQVLEYVLINYDSNDLNL